jgi:hypothetical protein
VYLTILKSCSSTMRNSFQWLDLCQLSSLYYRSITQNTHDDKVAPKCIKIKQTQGKSMWLVGGRSAECSPQLHRLWLARDMQQVPLKCRNLRFGLHCMCESDNTAKLPCTKLILMFCHLEPACGEQLSQNSTSYLIHVLIMQCTLTGIERQNSMLSWPPALGK